MAVTEYLVDTSAMGRMRFPSVREHLEPLLERGLVHTCAILNLEALYSAKNKRDYEALFQFRNATLLYIETGESAFERAQDVQRRLAATGRHRLSLPDLIIAAVAEDRGLTVLHYDNDYEIIADVTEQPHEWVIPQGSLP